MNIHTINYWKLAIPMTSERDGVTFWQYTYHVLGNWAFLVVINFFSAMAILCGLNFSLCHPDSRVFTGCFGVFPHRSPFMPAFSLPNCISWRDFIVSEATRQNSVLSQEICRCRNLHSRPKCCFCGCNATSDTYNGPSTLFWLNARI